ncbi:MAG: hypothetical protein AB7G80_07895 [Dongiaceae bacterium]
MSAQVPAELIDDAEFLLAGAPEQSQIIKALELYDKAIEVESDKRQKAKWAAEAIPHIDKLANLPGAQRKLDFYHGFFSFIINHPISEPVMPETYAAALKDFKGIIEEHLHKYLAVFEETRLHQRPEGLLYWEKFLGDALYLHRDGFSYPGLAVALVKWAEENPAVDKHILLSSFKAACHWLDPSGTATRAKLEALLKGFLADPDFAFDASKLLEMITGEIHTPDRAVLQEKLEKGLSDLKKDGMGRNSSTLRIFLHHKAVPNDIHCQGVQAFLAASREEKETGDIWAAGELYLETADQARPRWWQEISGDARLSDQLEQALVPFLYGLDFPEDDKEKKANLTAFVAMVLSFNGLAESGIIISRQELINFATKLYLDYGAESKLRQQAVGEFLNLWADIKDAWDETEWHKGKQALLDRIVASIPPIFESVLPDLTEIAERNAEGNPIDTLFIAHQLGEIHTKNIAARLTAAEDKAITQLENTSSPFNIFQSCFVNFSSDLANDRPPSPLIAKMRALLVRTAQRMPIGDIPAAVSTANNLLWEDNKGKFIFSITAQLEGRQRGGGSPPPQAWRYYGREY